VAAEAATDGLRAAEPVAAADEGVALAYVHEHRVSYCWTHSLIRLMGWDASNQGNLWNPGLPIVAIRYGTDGLVEARNQAVREFLKPGMPPWMFWTDTDMGFEPDTVDRLLDAADPEERPFVGGLCFTQREIHADGVGGWRTHAVPTIYDWVRLEDRQGFAVRWEYPPNTLIRVGGTGSACVLVHRSVFEKVAATHGPVWYNRVPNTTTNQLIGEDLSFCLRAGALQVPIHVHTGVRATHHKDVWLAEEDYWEQRTLRPLPTGEKDGKDGQAEPQAQESAQATPP
jgi:hypothetical protein